MLFVDINVLLTDGDVRSNVPSDQSRLQYFELLDHCVVQHPGLEQFGLCQVGCQAAASQR